MNQDDFKKILDESLKPLKEDINGVKEDLSGVKEDINEIKESLQSNFGALIRIESVLNGYADSYKINKHNIERLDTRLSKTEEKLDIKVSEDLKVPHFATE